MGYSNDPVLLLTFLRVMMMALATACGFGLGWLISPKARGLRMMAALGIAVLVGLVALIDNSPLGWSAAWLVAMVGFFVGLGYWLRDSLVSLLPKGERRLQPRSERTRAQSERIRRRRRR